jgi:hypothetical protein
VVERKEEEEDMIASIVHFWIAVFAVALLLLAIGAVYKK